MANQYNKPFDLISDMQNHIDYEEDIMIIFIDDRGYCLNHTDGVYSAGCHKFTKREALAHWGSPDYPNPDRGQAFCEAIERDREVADVPEGLKWIYPSGHASLPEGLKVIYIPVYASLPKGLSLPAGVTVSEYR